MQCERVCGQKQNDLYLKILTEMRPTHNFSSEIILSKTIDILFFFHDENLRCFFNHYFNLISGLLNPLRWTI